MCIRDRISSFVKADLIYYLLKGFTSLKFMAQLSDGLIEESVMKCGIWEDLFLLKIHDNISTKECSIHYYIGYEGRVSGGRVGNVEDCKSRIEICKSSNDCRPLFDGNTKANIVFRIGGSETSNDHCPKLILQMNANGFNDWKGNGSTFYVSYGTN